MSRWPHGRSDWSEVRDALARTRKGKTTIRHVIHDVTWPFDPAYVEHAVDLLARAKPPLTRISASFLERKLGIGYGAAGLLCDVLARTGLCDRTKNYAIVHLGWPPPADVCLRLRYSEPLPSPLQCMGADDPFVAFVLDRANQSKSRPENS